MSEIDEYGIKPEAKIADQGTPILDQLEGGPSPGLAGRKEREKDTDTASIKATGLSVRENAMAGQLYFPENITTDQFSIPGLGDKPPTPPAPERPPVPGDKRPGTVAPTGDMGADADDMFTKCAKQAALAQILQAQRDGLIPKDLGIDRDDKPTVKPTPDAKPTDGKPSGDKPTSATSPGPNPRLDAVTTRPEDAPKPVDKSKPAEGAPSQKTRRR